ncbi:MAG: ammonium transporter [Sporichthyaceae bacterium]
MSEINKADTAWILVCTSMVLVMTFGLAIFYGGMVRAKNVLNTMMMVVATIAILTVSWYGWIYSLAFTKDEGGGLIGGFDDVGMVDALDEVSGTVPTLLFASFQLTFALITCALVCGSIVDRAKFSAWCVFIVAWATLVYAPLAHWAFYFGHSVSVLAEDGSTPCPADAKEGECMDVLVDPGWIVNLGALDFAGGTVVEINSGASGLALALVLGARMGWKRDPMRPHNLTLVMLGAGLLWFGWFGFNAGSALGANMQAALVLTNTMIAGAVGIAAWLTVERLRDGTFTSFGAASGAVSGLVAITPSCAAVTPIGAAAVGLVAGAVCALAIALKYKLGYDDSLDVVGVHFVGGMVGMLMVGLVASSQATGILTGDDPSDGVDGLLYGGGLDQFGKQAVAAFAAMAYAFTVTFIIGWIIHKTIGFRATPEQELGGLDQALHAETAYELGTTGASSGRMVGSSAEGP